MNGYEIQKLIDKSIQRELRQLDTRIKLSEERSNNSNSDKLDIERLLILKQLSEGNKSENIKNTVTLVCSIITATAVIFAALIKISG